MGKAQSKRSVDITTETKICADDEITEKMEKIEDVDKKDVINGDASLSEKTDPEKKVTEDIENDKDMTTEKDADVQASGNSVENQNASEVSKDETGGSGTAEEISPLADETIKKSKKEKVKKKWSFRSISFGKKDKLKPPKNEDPAENGNEPANGGDSEEKPITEPEDTQKDKSEIEKKEKTTDSYENGNATPQELNEVEQNEKKTSEEKSNDVVANATTIITTEKCEPVQNETNILSSELSEKTENTFNATTNINENNLSENTTIDEESKNCNEIDEKMILTTTEQESQKKEVTNSSVEIPLEETSTNVSVVTNDLLTSTKGEVIEKIHQNGDHGESEQEVIENSKDQIEVNSNTDNIVSAATTLDYISSTSICPSNIQVHAQDFNASGDMPDEKIEIKNNESNVLTSTDIEVHTDVQLSTGEEVSMLNEIENDLQLEIDPDITSEIVQKINLSGDKDGVDPSPPPLPISPPPSQVSVFAFTNNDESIEDSIQTKNFERMNDDLVEKVIENYTNNASQCDLSETKNLEYDENIISNEILVEKTTNNDLTQIQILVDQNNQSVEIECDKIKGDEAMRKNEKCQDEETSVAFATSVINEITEKAIEIINQQSKCNEEQPVEQSEEKNVKSKKEGNSKNDEITNEEDAGEEFENHNIQYDNKEFVCKVTNSFNENTVDEQINSIDTDCSLGIAKSDSLQEVQDEMISVNTGDNLAKIV